MQNIDRGELKRFIVMFDRLVHHTNRWIEVTPNDKLEWVPVDNPNVRFGDRVSLVNIKGLYVHMAVGEYHWFRGLGNCTNNATIPLPKDATLTEELSDGDFVGKFMLQHEESMELVRNYSTEQLTKTIQFSGCTWTVMGFLWAIYGHRNYHLGNIDIYLRQSDTVAPDYFHFNPSMMA